MAPPFYRTEVRAAHDALIAQWLAQPGNEDAFRRALDGAQGERIGLLKEQHCAHVWRVNDLAHDVRLDLSADDPRGTFARVWVTKGFERVRLTRETAEWVQAQNDGVLFTIARDAMIAAASKLGRALDRKLTVY